MTKKKRSKIPGRIFEHFSKVMVQNSTSKPCVSYFRGPLSVDHLKMGLIRSGNTNLTPSSDNNELTAYLWPIVREMIKTAVENRQNLIVEGCYIPIDWRNDFATEYLSDIRCYCLIMSENYIRNHFADIKKYASVIETRSDDKECTMERVLTDNMQMLRFAKKHCTSYILIDNKYEVNVDL